MTKQPATNQDERRNAILQAAFTQFGQVGYSKATMKEIAAKAGVAQGLIGYHFNTKETLLVEVVREWMINRGMQQALQQLDMKAEPAELLQQALLHVVEFRKNNPEWFTLLISLWTESVNNEKLAQELIKLYQEMKAGIRIIIERLELPLNEAEQETFAALIQAVFDGLTLQSPLLLSSAPLSHNQVSQGIGWMLQGIRSAHTTEPTKENN
ncbi:TetR/AcrR family transcriptional regulator [Paenibacillus barcinonensis]|uniref:TetR family transcriptional regulator n=1 Tax=Paenibacillus barcinonensis TaxID=198119 RepID=A0A2V4W0Z0_PAEBA|nr:TetR/AcrR family transcriptional regulator [Paenibacillus barcinonensis]PYE48018.1 TetR family transcriptional regulator [Paenibacillus barcinonensis]QKS55135.1 TetR/AcrR family transcriptional regulator [Paenibacillus barcinonensis]